MFEHYQCFRCGSKDADIFDYPSESEDYTESTIICKECGTMHDVAVSIPIESKGMLEEPAGFDGICPVCGSYLILSGNNMLSELYEEEDYPEEDDAITMNCVCPNCGASVNVIPVKPSDEHNFNFFQTNEAATQNQENG